MIMLTRVLLTISLLFALLSCRHVDDKLYGYPYFEVKVVRGDTLSGLGATFAVPWRLIAYVNGLDHGQTIRPGQVLRIPQTDQAWASKAVHDRLAIQKKSQAAPARTQVSGATARLSHDYLYWPVEGEVSSHFGPRHGRMHEGIDIGAAHGTPIRAAASGRVVFAGWQRGYGRTLIVDHGDFRTLYAHCSKLNVSRGEWVERGSVIALVGATGRATGPHLHFEIRTPDGRPLDPGRREIAGLFRR